MAARRLRHKSPTPALNLLAEAQQTKRDHSHSNSRNGGFLQASLKRPSVSKNHPSIQLLGLHNKSTDFVPPVSKRLDSTGRIGFKGSGFRTTDRHFYKSTQNNFSQSIINHLKVSKSGLKQRLEMTAMRKFRQNYTNNQTDRISNIRGANRIDPSQSRALVQLLQKTAKSQNRSQNAYFNVTKPHSKHPIPSIQQQQLAKQKQTIYNRLKTTNQQSKEVSNHLNHYYIHNQNQNKNKYGSIFQTEQFQPKHSEINRVKRTTQTRQVASVAQKVPQEFKTINHDHREQMKINKITTQTFDLLPVTMKPKHVLQKQTIQVNLRTDQVQLTKPNFNHSHTQKHQIEYPKNQVQQQEKDTQTAINQRRWSQDRAIKSSKERKESTNTMMRHPQEITYMAEKQLKLLQEVQRAKQPLRKSAKESQPIAKPKQRLKNRSQGPKEDAKTQQKRNQKDQSEKIQAKLEQKNHISKKNRFEATQFLDFNIPEIQPVQKKKQQKSIHGTQPFGFKKEAQTKQQTVKIKTDRTIASPKPLNLPQTKKNANPAAKEQIKPQFTDDQIQQIDFYTHSPSKKNNVLQSPSKAKAKEQDPKIKKDESVKKASQKKIQAESSHQSAQQCDVIDEIYQFINEIDCLGEYHSKSKQFYKQVNCGTNYKLCAYYLAHEFYLYRHLSIEILGGKKRADFFTIKKERIEGELEHQQIQETVGDLIDQQEKCLALIRSLFEGCRSLLPNQDRKQGPGQLKDSHQKCLSSLRNQFKEIYPVFEKNKIAASIGRRCCYVIELYCLLMKLNGKKIKDFQDEKDIKNLQSHINRYKPYILNG